MLKLASFNQAEDFIGSRAALLLYDVDYRVTLYRSIHYCLHLLASTTLWKKNQELNIEVVSLEDSRHLVRCCCYGLTLGSLDETWQLPHHSEYFSCCADKTCFRSDSDLLTIPRIRSGQTTLRLGQRKGVKLCAHACGRSSLASTAREGPWKGLCERREWILMCRVGVAGSTGCRCIVTLRNIKSRWSVMTRPLSV